MHAQHLLLSDCCSERVRCVCTYVCVYVSVPQASVAVSDPPVL